LAQLQFEQFSTGTLNAARLCLLDAIGCGLYGSTIPEGQKVISALSGLGAGTLPVWGSPVSLNRSDAALVCGALCHLRELDDVHYSIVHPGAVIVPAVYAAAFGRGYSLNKLLTAMICGYEAMVRISAGSGYLAHRQKGWHATATMGAFGAAAACGKLLELGEQEMVWALGLAGSRTGGTWAFKADGSMSKRIHPGLAARDGLAAAVMAQAGISGPEFVLEVFFQISDRQQHRQAT
jgi:2-methylcitrate dehydratase PrpD